VSRVCRYEPDLNPSYQDFAEHYGVAILPEGVRVAAEGPDAGGADEVVIDQMSNQLNKGLTVPQNF